MNAGPSLGVAAFSLIAAIGCARRWPRTWLALILTGSIGLGLAAGRVLANGFEWEWRSGFLVGRESLHLRLDAISALFLVLVAIIGGAGAAYARGYWPDRQFPRSAPRGRVWWSALLLSLTFVLLSSNGLHFLIGWELFAICGYFLITLEGRRRDVRAAGWLYLAASHAGTVCLFAFFAAVAARTGSWDLASLQHEPALAPLLWIALLGFGVKAGVFPLHIWLPSAHANAPSHVSAILSGVAIKMGVYGFVRFSGWLPAPGGVGWVVIGLGSVGALLGIAFALAQNDLKRLLAYSSVENIGVIMIGLGGALIAVRHGDAPWGRLALAGALLHVWNHGLFKALLFFGAGSVLHATGTRDMSRLGGLWRVMPWTAALFTIGALAVSALPPLNGFVSEWLVYLGLLEAATSHGAASWATMPAAVMLAMTGALALATFVKASAIVFLGAARTKPAQRAHESGGWMRGPMLVLAALCIAAGLAPLLVWPAIAQAVTAWQPGWANQEPPPLGTISSVHAGLAVVVGIAVLLLGWRVRALGRRRAPTWDCGYAAPSPRMQYTSGSFAELATRWFSPVVRFERGLRRPRGVFPERALQVERARESVLELVLAPVARGVLWVSTIVRRLQHGRLQFYIVYVIVGLAGLGTLVLLEGRP